MTPCTQQLSEHEGGSGIVVEPFNSREPPISANHMRRAGGNRAAARSSSLPAYGTKASDFSADHLQSNENADMADVGE
jgi:hypothetical protein